MASLVVPVIVCGAVFLLLGFLASRFVSRYRGERGTSKGSFSDYVGDVQQFRQEYARYYGISLQNPDLEARFISARKYVDEKNYLGAATALERLTTSAALPMVFTDLGLMYAQINETQRAIDAFREVVVRDAAYAPMRTGVKSLNLARIEPARHEIEPNDSTFNATLLALGTPLEGELSSAGDIDYFRFVTPPAPRDTVSVVITTKSAAVNVDMYDTEGRLLEEKSGTAKTASFSKQVRLPPNSVYYLKIANRDVDSTKYLIDIEPLKTFDAFEPNDTLDTPRAITVGQVIEANIMDSKDKDFFQFAPANSGMVTVTVRAHDDGCIPAFSLLSANRTTIAFSIRPDRNQKVADYSFQANAKDQFYLQIWGLEETTGRYTLTLQQK